ncbi:hypothetical protein NPIL_204031 [Nephila pilipes]|uniref:Uncharacterized protein n=1 Tax=Nephila pilipes TaxID=299642 RepID=A0A8X6TW93_NEPPI|nr:hypothetical protein NPIL_204031 [Nephila pilipes]
MYHRRRRNGNGGTVLPFAMAHTEARDGIEMSFFSFNLAGSFCYVMNYEKGEITVSISSISSVRLIRKILKKDWENCNQEK